MRSTEFGIPYLLSLTPIQLFVYEMISEICNSKSYTILCKNNFLFLNFPEMDSVGKASPLEKSNFALSRFFLIISCHDCKLCVCFHFVSCSLAKRWCIHQPVNVYTNCLKQYLICGWLYRSQHDKFKKHGFELKFLFSIFSKLNQIKINKAGVKLQAYVTLQILCNP